MSDYKTLVRQAREAVAAGRIAEAETLTAQAKALKAIDDIDTGSRPNTDARLPLGATKTSDSGESFAGAYKAAYVRKYGDLDSATEQVLREVYSTSGQRDYYHLRAAKYAALDKYCRHNIMDPALSRVVLLTPEMVMKAVLSDVSVSSGDGSIKATMVEAQDQLGGFLLPEEMNTDIVQRLPGLTVVRGLARKYSTSRDQMSFLVRNGGNKQYIGNIRSKQTTEAPASAATSTQTNPLFGKLNIPVHVNLMNVPISKSLLEDSGVDIASQVLMPEIQAEAALTEDRMFLIGTGVNEPQGILNGLTGAPFNSDITIRSTSTTGVATAINFDAMVAAPYDLAGQYRARNNPSTAWVFNSSTAGQIVTLKNGVGEYLWREMYGNNAVGAPDTLRGWQVKESEAMPSISSNTFPIIFGDFSGYRIVDRIGMSLTRYDDSNTATNDSVVFYVRRRFGGQVAEGYRFVTIKIA